jgi:hypothetical protein
MADTRRSAVSPGGHAGPECVNRGDDLLPRLLARLELKTLLKFYGSVAAEHSDVFVPALVASCRQRKVEPKPLTEIVGVMSEEALVSLYRSRGPGFFKDYPEDEPALGRQLHEILQSLPSHFDQFRDRLDLVAAAAHLLPEDDDQTAATAWSTCRAAILDIGRLQDQRGGMLRQPPTGPIEAAARRMTEAVARALPGSRFEDDRTGSKKQKCLERVGTHLLAGKPLLPRQRCWQFAALWQKVAWHFERGVWPSAPLWKLRPKSKLPVPPWLVLCTLVVLVLLTVALVLITRSTVSHQPKESAASQAPGESGQDRQEDARQAERFKQQEARRRELAKAEQDRKREAEAEKKAAEEERQQQEREAEEKRLAAAAEAQRVVEKPPAQPAPKTAAAAPVRADADAWKTKAEQFARDHLGRFIDGEPLIDGRAEIPLDILPAAPPATTWFLGNGRIYLDNGTYPFGERFEKELPEVRYEIPALAADLHLKSAFVELHPRGDVLQLVVGGVPADPPSGSEAEKKPRADDPSLAILKQRCRTISVLIWQPILRPAGSAQAAKGPSGPGDQTGGPARPAASETPLPEKPPGHDPAAGGPPAIEGAFDIRTRPITKLRPPYMAKVRFQVIEAGGKPLRPDIRKSVVIGSLLIEKNKERMIRLIERPEMQVQEMGSPLTDFIYQDAVSLNPQIRFFRRAADRLETKLELLAVSTSQAIEPVKENCEYTVRFEISAAGLEKLVRLLEAH